MFNFREIYEAYLRCRKRKRNTVNALHYEVNLIENLCNLETSLNNGTYKPKRSVCFLTTSPKLREVFAADFSDRVVHHIVVPLLEQIWEPLKGTMALAEIKQFLSVQASFAGHIKHANSYTLNQKIGVLHETNPFDYARD